MLKKKEVEVARKKAMEMMIDAGINIGKDEIEKIEVADFGLNDLENEGAQIFTFVNTDRIGAKVIALFPGQTLPEHWHPPVGDDPGKEEIIRVIKGVVRAYLPGKDTLTDGFIPKDKETSYICRNEVVMGEREQIVLEPGTKHWFQAGEDGAVLYSFSTTVRDIKDRFSDPEIDRITKIKEND